jgi:hypothetical protein
MDDNGGRKGFQAEQWKHEKTDPGSGRSLSVQGARFEDRWMITFGARSKV